MILIKKHILFFLLCLWLTGSINAQSPRDNLLGRYIGIERQTKLSTGQVWTCPYGGLYDVKPSPLFAYPRLYINDSSCSTGGGWSGLPDSYVAFDDSTIRDNNVQTYIYGRLYPNDSLYIKWIIACCNYDYQMEFFGHKLYSYPAPIGLNEINDVANEITLYPQPASDILYIQSTIILFNEKKRVQLYDTKGRKIECSFDYINTHTFKVDVNNVAAGIYVLEIETDEGLLRKKVIITK